MKLVIWPKQTPEEQQRCRACHDAQLNVAAFLDRERNLLEGSLREHWAAMTNSSLAAREVCRACDRFRQAAEEAVRRHAAIQSIPAAAAKLCRAEGSYFLVVKAWANANLAVMETLAQGKPPFYVPVERLRDEAESARQRVERALALLEHRLGPARDEVDALKDLLPTPGLDETQVDTWQPQPYTHDFNEVQNRTIELQKNGLQATADIMAHNPAVGTNPCMNGNTTCPIDPADAAAWYNEGCGLTALGRHEEAVNCYDKAIEIDSRDAQAWFNKGVSLAALDRRQEAIDSYDKAIEIDPRDELAWYNKGVNHATLGRRREAVECFSKAIEIDPQDETAWCAKGVNLAALGRREEATACWDRALALDTRCVAAWCAKGVSLATCGLHGEAVACFEEALKIDPRLAPVWSNLGSSLTALSRHEEAIDCCDRALDIAPQDEAAWYNKGVSLAASDQHEEAIVCFDGALKIDPRLAAAWNDKGGSLAALGRHGEAIGCYDRALRIDPQKAATWYNKALVQEDCDRREDAVDSYRQFLEVAPPHHAELIAAAKQRIEELGGLRVAYQA